MTTLFSCAEITDYLKDKGDNWLASLRQAFESATGFVATSAGFAPEKNGDRFYFRFGVNEDTLNQVLDAIAKLPRNHSIFASLPDGNATRVEPVKSFASPIWN